MKAWEEDEFDDEYDDEFGDEYDDEYDDDSEFAAEFDVEELKRMAALLLDARAGRGPKGNEPAGTVGGYRVGRVGSAGHLRAVGVLAGRRRPSGVINEKHKSARRK